jgi:hypothetical protein
MTACRPGNALRGKLLRIALPVLACMSLTACNSSGTRQNGTAPNMNGDAMPINRNVADPNAPFTLRPRKAGDTPQLAARQPILDENGVPTCLESQLSLFETRSRMNGNNHTLRLTLENQGTACRLMGFPAVTLLGADGSVLKGITVQKVSAAALAASLTPARAGSEPGAEEVQPSPEVLLPPKSDAAFELGWSSGPGCAQVDRIAVSAPGNTQPSYVPRQLSLCGNSLLLTAVAPGGAD